MAGDRKAAVSAWAGSIGSFACIAGSGSPTPDARRLSEWDIGNDYYDRSCQDCGKIVLEATEKQLCIDEARARAGLIADHARRQRDKRVKALRERLEEMDRSVPTPVADEVDLRIARELQRLEGKG